MSDRIICRCEDVYYSQIEQFLDTGQPVSLHEIKRASRAGMGLCQGRTCGPLLESLVAGRYADRLERTVLARPVLLSDIAAFGETQA